MYPMYLLQDFGMVRTLLHLLKCKERYETPQIGKATTKFRYRFNNCKSKHGFQERKSKIPQKLFLSHYCHNCHLGNSSINFKNFIYHQVSMRKRSPYISILNIWVKVFKNGPSKICRRQPLKDEGPYRIETSPLICRAMDWFLYDRDHCYERVNKEAIHKLLQRRSQGHFQQL